MNKKIDERGFFQELLRRDLGDFFPFVPVQISWFSINPGKTRGGHYHKEQIEKFVVLEGTVNVTTEKEEGGPSTAYHNPPGSVFTMFPMERHTFYSELGCKILSLSNREFDPKSPDTYAEFDFEQEK